LEKPPTPSLTLDLAHPSSISPFLVARCNRPAIALRNCAELTIDQRERFRWREDGRYL
jgi:hypothetical protein